MTSLLRHSLVYTIYKQLSVRNICIPISNMPRVLQSLCCKFFLLQDSECLLGQRCIDFQCQIGKYSFCPMYVYSLLIFCILKGNYKVLHVRFSGLLLYVFRPYIIFCFYSSIAWLISTKLGTKHPWLKGNIGIAMIFSKLRGIKIPLTNFKHPFPEPLSQYQQNLT